MAKDVMLADCQIEEARRALWLGRIREAYREGWQDGLGRDPEYEYPQDEPEAWEGSVSASYAQMGEEEGGS